MKRILASLTIGLALLLAAGAVVAEAQGSGKTGTASKEGRFYGRVESFPPALIGTWRISGNNVQVSESTVIKEEYGKVRIGAYVEVVGSVSGNTLTATQITTKRDLK